MSAERISAGRKKDCKIVAQCGDRAAARLPGLLPEAAAHVIALAERMNVMWFDSNTQHTCEDCKYGNREENEHCGACILYQVQYGKSYSCWEPLVPWHQKLTEFMKESGVW